MNQETTAEPKKIRYVKNKTDVNTIQNICINTSK
jgi:hypothetical protein